MIPPLSRKAHTLKLSHVDAELVALFQHALAALLNKGIKLGRELCHALAQIVEAKVDAGQRVGGGGPGGGQCLTAVADGH